MVGRLLTYVLIIGLAFNCSNELEEGVVQINPTIIMYDSLNLEMLQIVNHYRDSIGSVKVQGERFISKQAKLHTDYLIDSGEINHNGAGQRLTNAVDTIGFVKYQEIVGRGYTSNQRLFNAYIRSQDHKDIINIKDFNYIGISSQLDDQGKWVNTIIFAKK